MSPIIRLALAVIALPVALAAQSAAQPVAAPAAQTATEVLQAGAAAPQQHVQVPREDWQRIPDIFAAMGVGPGAVVADIGAGDGYFTTRLAAAVGAEGRVYAVDINDSAIARLTRRLERDAVANVTVVLGTPADPKLPAGTIDAALIINAYHEMTQYPAMLAAIRTALKPQGRLVIVEPISDAFRERPRGDQEDRHEIAPQFIQRDALDAGYVVSRLDDPFTRRGGASGVPEYLLVLTPTWRSRW
jgi:predicted methyltransferase